MCVLKRLYVSLIQSMRPAPSRTSIARPSFNARSSSTHVVNGGMRVGKGGLKDGFELGEGNESSKKAKEERVRF